MEAKLQQNDERLCRLLPRHSLCSSSSFLGLVSFSSFSSLAFSLSSALDRSLSSLSKRKNLLREFFVRSELKVTKSFLHRTILLIIERARKFRSIRISGTSMHSSASTSPAVRVGISFCPAPTDLKKLYRRVRSAFSFVYLPLLFLVYLLPLLLSHSFSSASTEVTQKSAISLSPSSSSSSSGVEGCPRNEDFFVLLPQNPAVFKEVVSTSTGEDEEAEEEQEGGRERTQSSRVQRDVEPEKVEEEEEEAERMTGVEKEGEKSSSDSRESRKDRTSRGEEGHDQEEEEDDDGASVRAREMPDAREAPFLLEKNPLRVRCTYTRTRRKDAGHTE